MSTIKSFSVGNGDMFYIDHESDNFTIIDCCIDDANARSILNELSVLKNAKGVTRFISTHPDDDHIMGLERLDDRLEIINFYCVKNSVMKEDETKSFTRYCQLRDSAKKSFYIHKGCQRKWMNQESDERGSAGIRVLWPDRGNNRFRAALESAEDGGSPNNISPIIEYSLREGPTVLWMGDLETDFMEAIENELDLPKVDILFAPHHGRSSGKVPYSMLEKMEPRLIVIGEAPSEHLNYYYGYNTITQNSAGDIIFECGKDEVHIFTSFEYETDFLDDRNETRPGYCYAGTLSLDDHRMKDRTRRAVYAALFGTTA